MSLATIKGLDQYLGTYGPLLGAKAVETLDPLHVPETMPGVDMKPFLRQPFSLSQHAVISAAAKVWNRLLSVILCGEMGVGKTYLGAASVHAHAKGKPYRALIMAPNHLIDKWKREIEMSLPNARVITFEKSDASKGDDSFKEVLRYAWSCKSQNPRKWMEPTGPEWVIVGRNQAKWDPQWMGLGESVRHGHLILRHVPVGREAGRIVTAEVPTCPSCGQPVRNPGGTLASVEDLAKRQMVCTGTYLQEVAGDGRAAEGLDRICPIPERYATVDVGHRFRIGERTYVVQECGEHLWTWIPQPRKWAPARIIHKQCRGLFDYFILDEMHEEKGADSAQALAAAKLISVCERTIGMTGTLIGGYADHLFPLLYRLCAYELKSLGFEWGETLKFAKRYGRIDTTIVTKYGKGGAIKPSRGGKRRGAVSMRKDTGDDGVSRKREDVKPGIMPSLFGDLLIERTLFIGLDEMTEDLPELVDDDRSLIEVEMDPELRDSYDELRKTLTAAVTELMQRGSMKLLGAFLRTLLDYPDKPYGWEPPPMCKGLPAIGYWEDANDKRRETYIPVAQPDHLSEMVVRNKEQALVDLVYRELAEGRKCWVYCEMTGKRDIQGRLARMLELVGLRVAVLRSTTCAPRDREKWIAANGPHVDVVFSHPQLVSTGLDFFDKARTYNFPTIIFYQSGYEPNLIRQSGHRHWRIGQWQECRTYYLYYRDSMHHRAVNHVGEKLAAAKALEGKFSAEGLAALAGDTGGTMALAKTLSERITDGRSAWAKLNPHKQAKAIHLMKTGVLPGLAELAHTREIEARSIADEVLAADLDDLGDLDLPAEIDDAMMAEFLDSMQSLGLSLDDL